MSRLDEELLEEKSTRIRQLEEDVKNNCDKKAQEIISSSIQRCASEHTALCPTAHVPGTLPNHEEAD